jgi:tRNA nucleotidyltransferase (CCA-adding enzyme)
LPSERVWGELEKLLLQAERPSVGFEWLAKLNATAQLFPEAHALVGVPQEHDWHPEGDCDVHTWLTLDRAREQIDDLPYAKRVTVMLAALCHDFGKPATTEFVEGRIRSRGHDEAGVRPTIAFLDRLKIFTLEGYDVRSQIVELVRLHLKPGEFYRKRDEISDGAFRRLARRCELDLLYRVARADSLGRNAPWVPPEKWYGAEAQEWFIARARELSVEERAPAPLLMGRHLLEMGLKPSPLVGRVTRAVYEMQLDGRVRTLEEARDAARSLLAERAE